MSAIKMTGEDRSSHKAIATMAVVSISHRIVNLNRVGCMAEDSALLGWSG
jgi:hypothetical protein